MGGGGEDVGRVVIVSKEEEYSLLSCNKMCHGNCICGFLRIFQVYCAKRSA